MKLLTLQPDQILTTKDFPVHNTHILKLYYRMAKHDPSQIPPTPVVSIRHGLPLLPTEDPDAAHNGTVKKYFTDHPRVQYLMCDGSHKTTALTLTGNPIPVMVIEEDADLATIRQWEETGKIFSFTSPDTIAGIIKEKADHYRNTVTFETIADKTQRMIQSGVLPHYMSTPINA